jgi:hypothetical protein
MADYIFPDGHKCSLKAYAQGGMGTIYEVDNQPDGEPSVVKVPYKCNDYLFKVENKDWKIGGIYKVESGTLKSPQDLIAKILKYAWRQYDKASGGFLYKVPPDFVNLLESQTENIIETCQKIKNAMAQLKDTPKEAVSAFKGVEFVWFW